MLKLNSIQQHLLTSFASIVFFLIALVILAISLIVENQKQITGINEISSEPVNQIQLTR